MLRGGIQSGPHLSERGSSSLPSVMRLNRISASATSVSWFCSVWAPDSLMATVDVSGSPQLHCSRVSAQWPPLCFDDLTNSSFRNRLIYTHLSKCPGIPPLARATSELILEVNALNPIASAINRAAAVLTCRPARTYNACSSRAWAVLASPEPRTAARPERLANGGRELLPGPQSVRS